MKVKVMNIKDAEEFFKVIEQCEERVDLVTENGDVYNLKSKLSQYVSLTKVFLGGSIPKVELITNCAEDSGRIFEYMLSAN